jgi:hypothetical protein
MTSKYQSTLRRTRREVLRASVLAVVVAACGSKSASTEGAAVSPTAAPGAAPSDAAAVDPTAAPPVDPTTTAHTGAHADPTTTVVPVVAPADPAMRARVAFTYVASGGGGRVHNPYVAVWVESPDGLLVRTIGLSIQPGKGRKWWPDLKRWWRSDQARQAAGGADQIETIASPTRTPGAYEYTWDGTDDNSAPVAVGTYTLYIEAAREKGPYDVVQYDLVIDNQSMSVALEPVGDLQEISVAIESV